jgi:hypothetical protein
MALVCPDSWRTATLSGVMTAPTIALLATLTKPVSLVRQLLTSGRSTREGAFRSTGTSRAKSSSALLAQKVAKPVRIARHVYLV